MKKHHHWVNVYSNLDDFTEGIFVPYKTHYELNDSYTGLISKFLIHDVFCYDIFMLIKVVEIIDKHRICLSIL